MLRTLTYGINTTYIVRNTRIDTVPFQTCLIIRTIRIQNALRSATDLRVSSKIWQTRANGTSIDNLTDGIQSARTRHARIFFRQRHWNRETPDDRISSQPSVARAHGMMFFDPTIRVNSAGSRARVAAPVADASMGVAAVFVDDAFIAVTAQGASGIAGNAIWASAH